MDRTRGSKRRIQGASKQTTTPNKKKKKKPSDKGEYVFETKKEIRAAAREKIQHFKFLQALELQENEYLKLIMEEINQTTTNTDMVKPSSQRKSRRRICKKEIKSNTMKDESSSDDDVQFIKTVPNNHDNEDRKSDLWNEMIKLETHESKPMTTSKIPVLDHSLSTSKDQLRHPSIKKYPTTIFRLPVLKKSFGCEFIPFQLHPQEYDFLIGDANQPKCSGHYSMLDESRYPANPNETLCKRCHSMMFLRHCGSKVLNLGI